MALVVVVGIRGGVRAGALSDIEMWQIWRISVVEQSMQVGSLS